MAENPSPSESLTISELLTAIEEGDVMDVKSILIDYPHLPLNGVFQLTEENDGGERIININILDYAGLMFRLTLEQMPEDELPVSAETRPLQVITNHEPEPKEEAERPERAPHRLEILLTQAIIYSYLHAAMRQGGLDVSQYHEMLELPDRLMDKIDPNTVYRSEIADFLRITRHQRRDHRLEIEPDILPFNPPENSKAANCGPGTSVVFSLVDRIAQRKIPEQERVNTLTQFATAIESSDKREFDRLLPLIELLLKLPDMEGKGDFKELNAIAEQGANYLGQARGVKDNCQPVKRKDAGYIAKALERSLRQLGHPVEPASRRQE